MVRQILLANAIEQTAPRNPYGPRVDRIKVIVTCKRCKKEFICETLPSGKPKKYCSTECWKFIRLAGKICCRCHDTTRPEELMRYGFAAGGKRQRWLCRKCSREKYYKYGLYTSKKQQAKYARKSYRRHREKRLAYNREYYHKNHCKCHARATATQQ